MCKSALLINRGSRGRIDSHSQTMTKTTGHVNCTKNKEIHQPQAQPGDQKHGDFAKSLFSLFIKEKFQEKITILQLHFLFQRTSLSAGRFVRPLPPQSPDLNCPYEELTKLRKKSTLI